MIEAAGSGDNAGEVRPTRRSSRASQPAPVSRRRGGPTKRSFDSTLAALSDLARAGARVSAHVCDLDNDMVVFAGDDFVSLPVADVGSVAILVEVAAAFQDGRLDPAATVARSALSGSVSRGLWAHLRADELSLSDLAVLSAAVGDQAATNALLAQVGLAAVSARLEKLGLAHLAVLDEHRDSRGPDDAPQFALGTTRELAELMTLIVNGAAVDAAVSAQVGEWLNLATDLSMVGAATGLDPYDHEDDKHRLLFVNKTGRADGVRSEAGVLAGPRAGVAYAVTVAFDDLSSAHRLQVAEALRILGLELMEYVH